MAVLGHVARTAGRGTFALLVCMPCAGKLLAAVRRPPACACGAAAGGQEAPHQPAAVGARGDRAVLVAAQAGAALGMQLCT